MYAAQKITETHAVSKNSLRSFPTILKNLTEFVKNHFGLLLFGLFLCNGGILIDMIGKPTRSTRIACKSKWTGLIVALKDMITGPRSRLTSSLLSHLLLLEALHLLAPLGFLVNSVFGGIQFLEAWRLLGFTCQWDIAYLGHCTGIPC